MSTAVKPPLPPRTRPLSPPHVRAANPPGLGLVNPMPTAAPTAGVRLVLLLRKISTPLTLIAVLGLLPLHHWTIRTQRTWGETYRELEQLRQDERQLISLTEAQKHQITEQIEAAPVGVIPQGPATTIFLDPQPVQSTPELPQPSTTPVPEVPLVPPLGY